MLCSNEITLQLKVYILTELGNMFRGWAMLPGDCCLEWRACLWWQTDGERKDVVKPGGWSQSLQVCACVCLENCCHLGGGSCVCSVALQHIRGGEQRCLIIWPSPLLCKMLLPLSAQQMLFTACLILQFNYWDIPGCQCGLTCLHCWWFVIWLFLFFPSTRLGFVLLLFPLHALAFADWPCSRQSETEIHPHTRSVPH